MKVLKLVFIIIVAAIVLSSCGLIFGNDEYYDAKFNSGKRGREKALSLIYLINKKDASGIKNMFSDWNRKTKGNILDTEIQELLDAFPNGISEYEIGSFVGGHGSYESWSVIYLSEGVNIYLPIKGWKASDEKQEISIDYTYIDKDHSDQIGVNKIIFYDRTDPADVKIIRVGEWPNN